jgi:hypothetical protein
VSYDDGCDVTASLDTIEVVVDTLPEVLIDGNEVICQGQTTILDAGDFPGGSFLWSTGEETQEITVSTADLFQVTVTDGNGCVGSGYAITTIQSLPEPQILGDFGFCQGDSTILDAGSGYDQYLWSSGESSQYDTIYGPGPVTVVVTDSNGCVGSDTETIEVFDLPVPFISGSLGICIGSATQLDAGGGYGSYIWSTGETSQTIYVDTVGTFQVTVTDINGCIGSASASTTAEGTIPEAPGPITGPTMELCDETGVVYHISPVPNAAFYVWTVPDGVTIVSGQGDTSIVVDIDNSFTYGNIVVAASNACGQSPSIDPTFISIYGSPDTPGLISGPTENICVQSSRTYSISSVAGATSYSWTVPIGAVITSGQGSPSITLLFGSDSGEVCVTPTNGCGSSGPSCLTVTVPEFTVDAGDCEFVYPGVPPINCVDLTAITSGGAPPFTYLWTTLLGDPIGTTEMITVCPTVNTSYIVAVTDTNGCIATDKVEVETIIATCKGDKVLVCHSGKTLCLKPNTAQNHLDHGDTLGSCDADPCGGGVPPRAPTMGSINLDPFDFHTYDSEIGQEGLHIYPNPTGDFINVDLEFLFGASVEIEIYHALLGLIKSINIDQCTADPVKIEVNGLSSGMYIVSVNKDDGYRLSKTLIITR